MEGEADSPSVQLRKVAEFASVAVINIMNKSNLRKK